MQQSGLAAEGLALLGHRAASASGPCCWGTKVKLAMNCIDELIGNVVVGELLAGLVRQLRGRSSLSSSSSDVPMTRISGASFEQDEVQQAGQQLSACQIACGAEHYDDVRRRAVCLLLSSLAAAASVTSTIVTKAGRIHTLQR